jgi:hypothetical protein
VRLHDGKQVADEGALRFTMRPAEARTLRVVGLAEGDRIQVGFRAQPSFQTTNGGWSAWCDLAAAAAGKGVWSAEGVRNGVPLTAQVRFAEITAVPRGIVATKFLEKDGFRDFDVGDLRRMTVTVVDVDGSPAACACLGVAGLGCAPHLCWRTQLVTDGAGRAEFCMNRNDHWVIYATTGRAYALTIIKVQDPPGPIEMKLLPLPVMKLRIVDREHRAVRGAGLVCTGSKCGTGGGEAEVRALDGIALSTNGSGLWPLRSNAAGEVEVPFLDRLAVTTIFEVRAGKLVAGDLTLRAGEAVQEIVLR